MKSNKEIQLLLIEEIYQSLNLKNIHAWLAGGWALDFHFNRENIEHDDIDIFIHKKNYSDLEEILLKNNFSIFNINYHQKFHKENLSVDVIEIENSKENKFHIDLGNENVFIMPENSFLTSNTYKLNKNNILLISIQGQLILTKLLHQMLPQKSLREKDKNNLILLENALPSDINYNEYGLKHLT